MYVVDYKVANRDNIIEVVMTLDLAIGGIFGFRQAVLVESGREFGRAIVEMQGRVDLAVLGHIGIVVVLCDV